MDLPPQDVPNPDSSNEVRVVITQPVEEDVLCRRLEFLRAFEPPMGVSQQVVGEGVRSNNVQYVALLQAEQEVNPDEVFYASAMKSLSVPNQYQDEVERVFPLYDELPSDYRDTADRKQLSTDLEDLKRDRAILRQLLTKLLELSNGQTPQQIGFPEGATTEDIQEKTKSLFARFIIKINRFKRKYCEDHSSDEFPEFLQQPNTPEINALAESFNGTLRMQYDVASDKNISTEPRRLYAEYNSLVRRLLASNYRVKHLVDLDEEGIIDLFKDLFQKEPSAEQIEACKLLVGLVQKITPHIKSLADDTSIDISEVRLSNLISSIEIGADVDELVDAIQMPMVELVTTGNIHSIDAVHDHVDEQIGKKRIVKALVEELLSHPDFENLEPDYLQQRAEIVVSDLLGGRGDIQVRDFEGHLGSFETGVDRNIAKLIIRQTMLKETLEMIDLVQKSPGVGTDVRDQFESGWNQVLPTDKNGMPDATKSTLTMHDLVQLHYLQGKQVSPPEPVTTMFTTFKVIAVLKNGTREQRDAAIAFETRLIEYYKGLALHEAAGTLLNIDIGDVPDMPPELKTEFENMNSYIASITQDAVRDAQVAFNNSNIETKAVVSWWMFGGVALALAGAGIYFLQVLPGMNYIKLNKFKRKLDSMSPADMRMEFNIPDAVSDQEIQKLKSEIQLKVQHHVESDGFLDKWQRHCFRRDGLKLRKKIRSMAKLEGDRQRHEFYALLIDTSSGDQNDGAPDNVEGSLDAVWALLQQARLQNTFDAKLQLVSSAISLAGFLDPMLSSLARQIVEAGIVGAFEIPEGGGAADETSNEDGVEDSVSVNEDLEADLDEPAEPIELVSDEEQQVQPESSDDPTAGNSSDDSDEGDGQSESDTTEDESNYDVGTSSSGETHPKQDDS